MNEATDRYQALGMPYPDPETMCPGQCEGTGWVPMFVPPDPPVPGHLVLVDGAGVADDPRLRALWDEAERLNPSDDGWHFVCCPDCGGTGKQTGAR